MCPHPRSRFAITPTGNLAIVDGANITQWTTQTACLPVTSGSRATNPSVNVQVNTAQPSNLRICLHEPTGNVTLEDAATGAAMWSSSSAPCNDGPRQLISHSRSAVQCWYSTQPNLSSQDCSSHLSLASGPLALTGSTGQPLWSSPAPATPVRAPAGLCLQPNGSLVYSGAGGATRLWSSPAASTGAQGPFTAQIRDSALQVSCVLEMPAPASWWGLVLCTHVGVLSGTACSSLGLVGSAQAAGHRCASSVALDPIQHTTLVQGSCYRQPR
jgi:hypothetical protein